MNAESACGSEAAAAAEAVMAPDGSLRDALRSPDSQVRLNAAVRLAYLGSAEGIDDLLAGLAHESVTIRFLQIPDALALLPGNGLERLRHLAGTPGPARMPAARALALRGQFDGLSAAITAALRDPGARWMATILAGEVGPHAAGAADGIERAVRDAGTELAIGAPALVALMGERALPFVRECLTHHDSAMRVAALRALAALGPAAAPVADRLAAAGRDAGLPLRERLAAAHALVRVGASADEAAETLCAALPDADRWVQVGLLRTLTSLCPRYPLQPESTPYQWPRWEAQRCYAAPPRPVERYRPALLAFLSGLAFFGDSGRAAVPAIRRAQRLTPPLRHDLLRRLGEPSALDPAGFPWDVAMSQPALDLDAIAEPCERLWAQWQGGDLDAAIPVEQWAFLQYLVERHGLLLHGSRIPKLEILQPIRHSGGSSRVGDQPGVFAVDHALMAMYFGIIDRARVPSLSNGLEARPWPDGSIRRCFHLGVEYVALAARPFIEATVYVLPPDTFTLQGEWTSLVPVRPLARVPVAPADFPLLERLWGSDLGPLAAQFGDEYPYLQDVGRWATKRSAVSARA